MTNYIEGKFKWSMNTQMTEFSRGHRCNINMREKGSNSNDNFHYNGKISLKSIFKSSKHVIFIKNIIYWSFLFKYFKTFLYDKKDCLFSKITVIFN